MDDNDVIEARSTNTAIFDMKKTRKKRKPNATGNTQTIGEAPSQKKRKCKAKAGHLEGLMSVPMDVLFEIFSHLFPIDILHLARTTKEFRRVLLHKSSISVWKSARTNVRGLPECPFTMSEPEFANLAFDQHCHFCLARTARSVEWRLRSRICSKCAKIKLVEPHIYDRAYELVLSRFSRPGRFMCFVDELNVVRNHLESLDDPDLRSAYYKYRKSIVDEVRMHAILCEEWAATTKVNRSQELEDARQDRKNAIIDRLTELGWGEEIEELLPRDDLGLHTLAKQPTRLTDRIWKNIKAPLVQYMETMKTARLKRERQALIISRKPAAINVLRAYKISCLPITEVMPEPVDFCAFPEVQVVLELPNEVDVDESSFSKVVPLLPSIFDRWRTNIIQRLIDRVRQGQKDGRGLREQETTSAGDPQPKCEVVEDPAGKMKLATTVFKCRKCVRLDDSFHGQALLDQLGDVRLACHRPVALSDFSNPLFYPQVLGHRCLTVVSDEYFDTPTRDPSVKLDMDLSPWVPWRYRHRQNWDPNCLAIDMRAGEIVEHIIRVCGLDPTTTTAEDMDRLDARLGCPKCVRWHDVLEGASTQVFGWRTAVQHQAYKHKDETLAWITLDDDEDWFAREVENAVSVLFAEESGANKTIPQSNVVSWMCAHCLDLQSQLDPQELHVTLAHLNTVHQVESPVLNEDYFKDFEAPQGYRTDMLFEVSSIPKTNT